MTSKFWTVTEIPTELVNWNSIIVVVHVCSKFHVILLYIAWKVENAWKSLLTTCIKELSYYSSWSVLHERKRSNSTLSLRLHAGSKWDWKTNNNNVRSSNEFRLKWPGTRIQSNLYISPEKIPVYISDYIRLLFIFVCMRFDVRQMSSSNMRLASTGHLSGVWSVRWDKQKPRSNTLHDINIFPKRLNVKDGFS